jgi:hypothetical protein
VWARGHFTLPYLASTVDKGAHAGEIELRDGERRMALSIDGDVDQACSLLTDLTRPGSDTWALLAHDAPIALVDLVTDLDRLGWLREGDGSGRKRRDRRAHRLDRLLASARRWLQEAGGVHHQPVASGNLLVPVLETCRRVWRRSSPLTDAILADLLDGHPVGSTPWDPVALAVCDFRDVEQQVWAALQLIVMSRSDHLSARYVSFVPPELPDGPAINVLVTAERCAEALLAELGEPELHRVIDEPGGAGRAAPIVFQHRWFATIRYVEAAAGLLRFRLGDGLRTLVLQYLREEMGHEIHESETCHELGISERDLAGFAPLACFAAYPELLGDLAERRPLSFLLTMTVAEGMPGGGHRLTERLARHGVGSSTITAHDEIDRELGHEMVTRTLLAQLDWVGGDAASEAIADFLSVVELAHAGWQTLSRYVEAGLADVARPFALTPDAVAELCRPGDQPLV